MVIAFIRVIFSAIALPLETVMLSIYASELFGNKSFDKAVGVFAAANYAGFALGAPFANLFFDIYGSYNIPFLVFGIMMLFVTASMQIVLRLAKRDKIKILEALESTAEN